LEAVKRSNGAIIGFRMSEEEFSNLNDAYSGMCMGCGEEAMGGTEPDARNYKCEGCGAEKVFGAEELLIMGQISLTEEV
jgi:hypothetical protein